VTQAESDPKQTPEPARKPRPPFGRLLFLIGRIFLVVAVVGGVLVFVPGPLPQPRTVIVPSGSHVYDIISLLDTYGVTNDPVMFRLGSKLLAHDALKAGEYEFPAHVSIAGAVEIMHEGRSIVHLFTVAEGLTSAEIVAMMDDLPFTGSHAPPPAEGTLLPETYRYNFGDNRASLIGRMQKGMQDTLNALWNARDPGLPLKSPQEALIMASIIEKETGKKEERPRIARVFYNRLAHSMRLQSDPTAIYAITHGKGPLGRALTHDDLATASPYNTYMSDGLPPGPICNPGRASIEAALHPEANDFLYFVADGSGGHVFSKNLNEHNVNVTKWNEIKDQQNAPKPDEKPEVP
jgi:UPF0755 protein